MAIWMQAGLWGLAGASSLLIGVALAWFAPFPKRVTTGFMAFGCGVLISAVSYDLIQDGFGKAGIWPVVLGAVAGSVLYTVANELISRNGGHHRKRSGKQQRHAAQGGGLAIAAGACWGWECWTAAASASPCSRRSSCRTFPKVCPAQSG